MAVTTRLVISSVLAFFLFAIVFPIAMTQVTGANTTGWNTAVTTIFNTLVPILCAIGIAVNFIMQARK